MRYRIAHWTDSGLIVDGDPIRWLPRGKQAKGEVWYLVGRQTWGDVASGLFRVGDRLHGRRRGEPLGAQPVDGPQLRSGDAWGLPGDPIEARQELDRLMDCCRSEGIEFRPSAAATVGPMVEDLASDELRPLPPRWRRLAHRGMHSGPCAVVRASEPDAIQLDQRQAYLRGLGVRLPVWGSWRSSFRPWSELQGKDGLVTASVDVPELGWPIGPLPVDAGGLIPGVSWPVGTIAGTWPIEWLAWAEEHAAITVRAVHDAIVWRTGNTFGPVQDRIAEVKDKKLRRLLYTRAVGRLASSGRWVGEVVPHPKIADRVSVQWTRQPETPDAGMPRWYRPDVAAIILGETARRTIAAAALYDAALVHVDAVWVPAVNVEAIPEGWAVKGRGSLRAYGVGTYTHGDEWGAQGIYGVGSAADLAAHVAGRRSVPIETLTGRSWSSSPATDEDAVSRNVVQTYDTIRLDPATWQIGQWSSGGYRLRSPVDQTITAHRADLDGIREGWMSYRDDQTIRDRVRDVFDVAV